MSIISFNTSDLLSSMLVKDGGWYPAVVTEFEEPKNSKSGKSLTYWVTFTITGDSKYAGKEMKIAYNTETNQGSILGTAQFEPSGKIATELWAAVTGNSPDLKGMAIDTDLIKGQPVGINITLQTVDGALVNMITGLAPISQVEKMSKAAF